MKMVLVRGKVKKLMPLCNILASWAGELSLWNTPGSLTKSRSNKPFFGKLPSTIMFTFTFQNSLGLLYALSLNTMSRKIFLKSRVVDWILKHVHIKSKLIVEMIRNYWIEKYGKNQLYQSSKWKSLSSISIKSSNQLFGITSKRKKLSWVKEPKSASRSLPICQLSEIFFKK